MAHSLTAPASRTSDYLEDSKISNVWKHHEHHHLFGSSTRSPKNGSILKELGFFSPVTPANPTATKTDDNDKVGAISDIVISARGAHLIHRLA